MNKIIIGLGILAIIAVGWMMFGSSTVEYVATVEDEVTQLENELVELEAMVAAGTLSPEEAAQAQEKIVSRINTINEAVASGQKTNLTDAQNAQLVDGLARLKQILINHQATLVAVDKAVMELPESERPTLKQGGKSNRNGIVAVVGDAINDIDNSVEDIIADIEDETIAEDVSDEYPDEEFDDTSSTTSDETTEETNDDTSSEDTSDSDGSDETTTDEELEVSTSSEATS
ncbi:hypothetical protein KC723_03155, partial [Candidatus Kaiserbacteria bacterium]|nr:hypothetical protein [Candidatus Kaiserbacteria bacterium]